MTTGQAAAGGWEFAGSGGVPLRTGRPLTGHNPR